MRIGVLGELWYNSFGIIVDGDDKNSGPGPFSCSSSNENALRYCPTFSEMRREPQYGS